MTIYYDFAPDGITVPQYNFMLDGGSYNAKIEWNVFGERYYMYLYNTAGNLVFAVPLIPSPKGTDISISAGYFTTKIVYRYQNNQIEVI